MVLSGVTQTPGENPARRRFERCLNRWMADAAGRALPGLYGWSGRGMGKRSGHAGPVTDPEAESGNEPT